MNDPHQDAGLAVHGRARIVARHRAGRPAAVIAGKAGVPIRTVCKWLRRCREGARGAFRDRLRARPAPQAPVVVASGGRQSRSRSAVALLLHLRRLRMNGPAVAARLGRARAAVARWLRRAGPGRLCRLDPPQPVRRCRRGRKGAPIRPDIKKRERFDRPGQRMTGSPTAGASRDARRGFAHVAPGDATRPARVAVPPDARKQSATAFPDRAPAWFAGRGRAVERVTTDSGSCSRSRRYGKALAKRSLRHIRSRP